MTIAVHTPSVSSSVHTTTLYNFQNRHVHKYMYILVHSIVIILLFEYVSFTHTVIVCDRIGQLVLGSVLV